MSYKYDYVELPVVELGDVVRVEYESPQSGSTQEREGTVVELHVNGFELDCGRDCGDNKYRVNVRDHEKLYSDGIYRDVSTLKLYEPSNTYGHAAALNRNNTDIEKTPVELVDEKAEASP